MAQPNKDRGFWMLGGGLEELTGLKLPSLKQVLRRFLQLHVTEKKTIRKSANITAIETMDFWLKAQIPTKRVDNVVTKIEKVHEKWLQLKKDTKKKYKTQPAKEKMFSEQLDDLFDIAHENALNDMKIKEDRDFLLAQREKGRRGTMGPVDKKFESRLKERSRKDVQKRKRLLAEINRKESSERQVMLSETSSASESEIEQPRDVLFTPRLPPKTPRLKTVMTPELTSALDRAKISDRNATYVLAAAAQSLGHDINDISVNRETIRLARAKNREQISNEIKSAFTADTPLVIHWDGKMLQSLTNSAKKVDRLAVLVSGDGVMKLLGVPEIASGTGEEQATAIFELLEKWGIGNQVALMSFDTTASNTGIRNGACVLLEKKMKRELIGLPCRHHILELIVAAVFNSLMGPSTGPNIKMFQRFSDEWMNLDKLEYEDGMLDDMVAEKMSPMKDEILNFIRQQLHDIQPRDDYRELLILSMMFLGAKPEEGIVIRKPGAYHRARWMAKLIYCLKIFLFRSQFILTAQEIKGLRDFNVFIVSCYLKMWFTAPSPSVSPRNDLELLSRLEDYANINKSVSMAALKSFSGHLWYISETLVGLSFFDPQVPANIKREMVQALERPGNANPVRKLKYCSTISRKKLSDFVTSNSYILLRILSASLTFLQIDPTLWERNAEYIQAKQKVDAIKVVNDAAERGVKLISDFNEILCNSEEQKQYLLQVVEQHRTQFPDPNKSTLVKGLTSYK